jgi:hypothetical protein
VRERELDQGRIVELEPERDLEVARLRVLVPTTTSGAHG